MTKSWGLTVFALRMVYPLVLSIRTGKWSSEFCFCLTMKELTTLRAVNKGRGSQPKLPAS